MVIATPPPAPFSGTLVAVDAGTITIRRGSRTATLSVHARRVLRGARPGDLVRATARVDRNRRWAVTRIVVTREAPVPKVTITAGPTGTVHDGTATFAFRFGSGVIWLGCSLDGSTWYGCDSPTTLPVLGPGAHRFAVLAMNGRHSTVVVRDWTIGTDVPPVLAAIAPTNSAPPTIGGTAQSKKTVTAAPGTWQNGPTGFNYQWLRCTSTARSSCSPIGSATGSSYTCQTADVDTYLRVEVTGVNSGGQATAVSAATPKTLPS